MRISEGLAGLGERELSTLIENTRVGTCKRDPTNVEKKIRRAEQQARASVPPADRSPGYFAAMEPKAKAVLRARVDVRVPLEATTRMVPDGELRRLSHQSSRYTADGWSQW